MRNLLIVGLVLFVTAEANGQRYIVIKLNTESGVFDAHDIEIGMSILGSPTISPLFAGNFPSGSSDPTKLLRDSMVPEIGISGAGKRAQVSNDFRIKRIHFQ